MTEPSRREGGEPATLHEARGERLRELAERAALLAQWRAQIAEADVIAPQLPAHEREVVLATLAPIRAKAAALQVKLNATAQAVIDSHPEGRDGVRRDVVDADPEVRAVLVREVARRDRFDADRRRYEARLARRSAGRPCGARRRPSAARREARPRQRRSSATSRTSGADPGGSEPSPPRSRAAQRRCHRDALGGSQAEDGEA